MSMDAQFRRPEEADHRRLVAKVDQWSGGRGDHPTLLRLWFQHFTETSWIADDASGAPIGFLIGFISADHPDRAYIHMVATSPNHRRRGLARALYARFFEDVAERGVRRVNAISWPGNRVSIGFHLAIGFTVDDGPGTQRLYGTPAYPDYEAEGDDRVVFGYDL